MMRARQAQQDERTYRVEIEKPEEGIVDVHLEGTLTFADGRSLWSELNAFSSKLLAPAQAAVRFDLSKLESIDGGAMALLVQAKWDLQTAGARCEFVGGNGAVEKILTLYEGEAQPTPEPKHFRAGFFGQAGNWTVAVLKEAQLLFAFAGSMVLEVAGVFRRPRTGNWHDIAPTMTRTGADAVPIVVLFSFLIGFVMAFQSSVQLKQFGANIYVADLVALSITRELGPLMTAIIVAGRSGAAFASELGTMKVSEEIDALRTMGIGPLRFLVFPRIIALFLVLPVLTLLGDLVGMVGGLLVGVTNLDLTIVGYVNQTGRALHLWDVSQGLIKAGVFGLAIGLISCAQGLSTTGGAAGVGQRTTTSVVTSLMALILIDAAFTLFFFEVGL